MEWFRRARARLAALDERASSASGMALAATAVFCVAFALRCWVVRVAHPPAEHVFSDMWVYTARAEHLHDWKLTPWDSFTPVGYPALLAATQLVFGKGFAVAAMFNAWAGAIACALCVLIARRVTGSGLLAWVAGVVTAFHWPWLHYVGFLLSETLCTMLLLFSVWLLLQADQRPRSFSLVSAGLALGAAIAVRANVAPFLAIVPLFFLLGHAGSLGRALFASTRVWAGAALPLALAACFYSAAMGRLTLSPTNGGLNFYLNFSEVRAVEYRSHFIEPIPNAIRYESVAKVSVPFYEERYYYRLGLRSLGERPERLLRTFWNLGELSGIGEQQYWPEWLPAEGPIHRYSRVFLGFVIVPALVHAAWVLAAGWRAKGHGAARLLIASFLAAGSLGPLFYLGDPRMRVPFDGLLLIAMLDGLGLLLRTHAPDATNQQASSGVGRVKAGAAAISP